MPYSPLYLGSSKAIPNLDIKSRGVNYTTIIVVGLPREYISIVY